MESTEKGFSRSENGFDSFEFLDIPERSYSFGFEKSEVKGIFEMCPEELIKEITEAKLELIRNDADEDEKPASCSSEITELSSSQYDNLKDLNSKPCCFCIIF